MSRCGTKFNESITFLCIVCHIQKERNMTDPKDSDVKWHPIIAASKRLVCWKRFHLKAKKLIILSVGLTICRCVCIYVYMYMQTIKIKLSTATHAWRPHPRSYLKNCRLPEFIVVSAYVCICNYIYIYIYVYMWLYI